MIVFKFAGRDKRYCWQWDTEKIETMKEEKCLKRDNSKVDLITRVLKKDNGDLETKVEFYKMKVEEKL